MARSTDSHYRNCVPVDPCDLWVRLSRALGFEPEATVDGFYVIRRPMPELDGTFRDKYLLKELLRKYPAFELGIDTKDVAITGLYQSMRHNIQTAKRIESREVHEMNHDVMQVYNASCRKISRSLGKFRWSAFEKGARFGPGSTTSVRKQFSHPTWKLSGRLDVTSSAYGILRWMLSSRPLWVEAIHSANSKSVYRDNTHTDPTSGELVTHRYYCYDLDSCMAVRENDVCEVAPKNATTGRVILKQPDGNVIAQLGVGRAIREVLYDVCGVNLQRQEINQQLAKSASLDSDDATLDLKNASNSLTYQVVYDHIGNYGWMNDSAKGVDGTWWLMLDALRTTQGVVDGTRVDHEMFSAMGNGFTFELQSLIFWGLATSTCDFLGLPTSNVSVYGDDLIVPCDAVPLLTRVLAFAGFDLNQDKSFSNKEGPKFRESCGKHYLDGKDVTPFYVKDSLDNAETIILAANNLRRWAYDPVTKTCDSRIRPVYAWLVAHLSPKVRQSAIPFGEANDGLIKTWDECCPPSAYIRSDGLYGRTHIGYYAFSYSVAPRKEVVNDSDWYVYSHYKRSVAKFSLASHAWYHPDPEEDRSRPKGRGMTVERKKRVVHHWPNLGQWDDFCRTNSRQIFGRSSSYPDLNQIWAEKLRVAKSLRAS